MATASLVISIIALGLGVLALPTVFQMWFGRPHIAVEYVQPVVDEPITTLRVALRNVRVSSRLLRKIGVVRSKAIIQGIYSITDERGKLLDQSSQWFHKNFNSKELVLHLEEREVGTINVITRNYYDSAAFIGEIEYSESVYLKPGKYNYSLKISLAGNDKIIEFKNSFIIEKTAMNWLQ